MAASVRTTSSLTIPRAPAARAAQDKRPLDWSPDGHFLLYVVNDSKTAFDIWRLPVDGDRKPFPVVQTNFDENLAQFSPDGKWIAYQSNESGVRDLHYIQPFPGPGSKIEVTANGAAQVRWSRDGKELVPNPKDGHRPNPETDGNPAAALIPGRLQ